jgi:hypothetical protein
MKSKRYSFGGEKPIFTGSPSIVPGGFNLDVEAQSFIIGSEIPPGTLAIFNEQTRKVKVIKTAKVKEIESDNKTIYLVSNDTVEPCFAAGDRVLKDGAISGTFAAAPNITKVERKSNGDYIITISAAISGLSEGDTIVQVVANGANAAIIGDANGITFDRTVVKEDETAIDVSADTMQYAMYERRVNPIPASQKDTTGNYLKANPHIKLSQSF